ncbi:hypothetical protein C8Q75DRAFT_313958 [Abortiporus biennis]|nr:hypothetical protein C8Q75DRAFT_313958 [Abortiporus biennis]
MPSGKLHLKRTPAEQAAHDLRKAQKAARKAARRATKHAREANEDPYSSHPSSSKRRRTDEPDWGYDSDTAYGPPPPSSSSSRRQPDYDHIHAQMEEERFREKMWGAFEDDERLDSVEARLNDYAHIPRRWRDGGMDRMDDELNIDPQYMEEEDYAEWVRAGIWKKQHAKEHAEQLRQEAERKARKKREKALREETERLERHAEEERRRKRLESQKKLWVEAREQYEFKWTTLLGPLEEKAVEEELTFHDIPWPVFVVEVGPSSKGRQRAVLPGVIELQDITAESISTFLFPKERFGEHSSGVTVEELKKERKDKLRETMLRFHPDKFEGRILGRVQNEDQDQVREAVGMVARAVTSLMGSK